MPKQMLFAKMPPPVDDGDVRPLWDARTTPYGVDDLPINTRMYNIRISNIHWEFLTKKAEDYGLRTGRFVRPCAIIRALIDREIAWNAAQEDSADVDARGKRP